MTKANTAIDEQMAPDKDSLFLPKTEEEHWYYGELRDSPREKEARKYVEESWRLYKPYCPDKNFKQQCQQNIFGTLWHLHLARELLYKGYQLEKTGSGEPDICVLLRNRRIWIEATCAQKGTGVDAVKMPLGPLGGVSERDILLRVTSALGEKVKQHKCFFDSEDHKNDAYIIALSVGSIPDADLHDGVSNVEKALFGIGDYTWVLDRETGEDRGSGFFARKEIRKRSGNAVPTCFFENGENCFVSGVLYTEHSFMHNWHKGGRDFVLVHNCQPRNSLPRFTFRFGNASWTEGQRLYSRQRRTLTGRIRRIPHIIFERIWLILTQIKRKCDGCHS